MEETARQLKIKVGVVKRLTKEHASYQKEIDQQTAKIEKMTTAGDCEHDIKQQVDAPAPACSPLPSLLLILNPSLLLVLLPSSSSQPSSLRDCQSVYSCALPPLSNVLYSLTSCSSSPRSPPLACSWLTAEPERSAQGGAGVPGRLEAEARGCSGGAGGAVGGGGRLVEGKRGLRGSGGPCQG
mmetsp:Transcript_10747/g.36065  ORF Transcript_10747/g.36065 Transcript_10747/m.36065 type:complete len:183 (-) Transcript_10747:778-1326(-)